MHEKYGFDRETAVTARPGEPSVYDAELHEGWRIGMGVNGGLLLALAGRALAEELGGDGQGHRDPFSISAYYLSTSLPGPVTARTETLRRGRTVSTGMVSLVQNGEERLRAIATYGDLNGHDHAGDVRTSATPPQMPPPEKCVGTDAAPPEFLKNSPCWSASSCAWTRTPSAGRSAPPRAAAWCRAGCGCPTAVSPTR